MRRVFVPIFLLMFLLAACGQDPAIAQILNRPSDHRCAARTTDTPDPANHHRTRPRHHGRARPGNIDHLRYGYRHFCRRIRTR